MKTYIALATFPFLAFATPSLAQNRVDLGAQALSNIRGSMGVNQGESVNILLNFTQFFETRIEYRFQIFTAHSCDFLLPSYARLA